MKKDYYHYHYQKCINETLAILEANPKWKDSYIKYAEDIIRNKDCYSKETKRIKGSGTLPMYSTISRLKKLPFTSDLRYGGKSVGEILFETTIKIRTNKDITYNKEISRNTWYEWNSKEAQCIRKYFKEGKEPAKYNEHFVESRMLSEFKKKSRKEKALPNVRPVCLGGLFFQFTTPLKASSKEPMMAKTARGGGIDILARIKTKNKSKPFNLAVIELKDENKNKEPQCAVMSQAIIYATFVASLLRSKGGKMWWQLFRERKEAKVPKDLDIYVVTLMPEGDSEEGYLGNLKIKELSVTFHLCTLYYKYNQSDNSISFSGTLKEELLP